MSNRPANGVGERSLLLPNGTNDASPGVADSNGAAIVLPSSALIEPPNQKRSRWRSIRVMYFTMFMSSVTFTMTMSTLWPYLQVLDVDATPSLLGWVVAAYSLGQLVASPFFGLWSAKRLAREPLVVSLLLQIGANIFYAYLQSIHGNGGTYLVLSRILIGFASGNAAVVRAYVSRATTLTERTGAMTNVSMYQSVGFILGPVIQTALVAIKYPGPAEGRWLHFNMYTAPALLAALLALLNLALLLTVFQLHSVDDSGKVNVTVIADDDDEEEEEEEGLSSDAGGPPDYIAVVTTMILFFIVFFMFTIFETIGTPLLMDMYGWTKTDAALYMGIMLASAGVLAIGVFIVVKVLSARGIDERKLLIGGYMFCFLGFFTYIPWGHHLPAIAYATIAPAGTIPPGPSTPPPGVIAGLAWITDRPPAWQQKEGRQPSGGEHSFVHSIPQNLSLGADQSAIVRFRRASPRLQAGLGERSNYRSGLSEGTENIKNKNPESMLATSSSSVTISPVTTTLSEPLLSETTTSATILSKTTLSPTKTIIPLPVEADGPVESFLALKAATATKTPSSTTTPSGSNTTASNTTMTPSSTTTPSGSNTTASNTTSAPNGCPYNFAWCGQVPRVELYQFILGTAFIAVGYPICNVMTFSLYSKVLGPQPQGLWMGFLTACGSLARTLGPIFVAQIYDAFGPRVTFSASCAVLLATIVFNFVQYRRLLPFAVSPYRKRPGRAGIA